MKNIVKTVVIYCKLKLIIFSIFNVYFCYFILSVLLSSFDLHCGIFLLRSVFFLSYTEKLSLTYLSQNHLLRIKNRTYVMQCTGLTDFPIRFERALSEAKVVEQQIYTQHTGHTTTTTKMSIVYNNTQQAKKPYTENNTREGKAH